MKKIIPGLLFILLATFSGCAVAGSIFKGGMWFGIIIVVVVIAVIGYFFTRNKN